MTQHNITIMRQLPEHFEIYTVYNRGVIGVWENRRKKKKLEKVVNHG